MRSSKSWRSTLRWQAIVPPGVIVTSGKDGKEGGLSSNSPGAGLLPAVGADGDRCTITFGLAASLIAPKLLTSLVRSWPQTVAVAVTLIALSCSSDGAAAPSRTLITPSAS